MMARFTGRMWFTACLTFAFVLSAKAVTFEYFPGVGYYYVYNSNQAWSTGHKACQDQGANLGVVNTVAEAVVFDELVVRHNMSMWVGISDTLVPGTLVTVKGDLVVRTGFNEWLNGTPGEDPAKRCTQYTKQGVYVKAPCASLNYSICELPLWTGDYELVPGVGYYKMHEHAATFEEAWTMCESEGAHLLVLNSELEYGVVQKILHSHPVHPDADFPNFFHVGVHSKYGSNYYVTVDGKPIAKSGFSRWDSPPNSAAVYGSLKLDGNYNQASTGLRLAFVCEHTLP